MIVIASVGRRSLRIVRLFLFRSDIPLNSMSERAIVARGLQLPKSVRQGDCWKGLDDLPFAGDAE